jgi:colicin import membrane protein
MVQDAVLAGSHGELLPRAPGGSGAGAVLALLAHAVLIAALTFAVDWRTRDPEPVVAELWSSVPRALAPEPQTPTEPKPPSPPEPTKAPVEQPPEPPKAKPEPKPEPLPEPDIAAERAERRREDAARKQAEAKVEAARQRELAEQKLEKDKKQAKAKADAEAEKKKQEQEARETAEKRLVQQREDNLKRIMGEAGKATGTANTTARPGTPSAAAMAAYTERLAALIRGNTVYSGSPPDNAPVVVEVRTAAGGTILSRRVLRGSGHADWDEAVLRAVDRTGTLPANVDGKVPETLIIDFKPRE